MVVIFHRFWYVYQAGSSHIPQIFPWKISGFSAVNVPFEPILCPRATSSATAFAWTPWRPQRSGLGPLSSWRRPSFRRDEDDGYGYDMDMMDFWELMIGCQKMLVTGKKWGWEIFIYGRLRKKWWINAIILLLKFFFCDVNGRLRLQEPTELWRKKNVSIYRRRLSMIEKLRTFFFSIIIFSIIICFSIILSVTVCPSIRNLNAF